MKTLTALTLALVSGLAQAEGFVCQSMKGDLNVKIFNKVQPEAGVRNAAVMVLSNPHVQYGRKTIATFKATSGVLLNEGTQYTALVDLRLRDSKRSGELIGGTKLGELEQVDLDIDFTYSSPVEEGEEVGAELSLTKRNGDIIVMDLLCARYLKN